MKRALTQNDNQPPPISFQVLFSSLKDLSRDDIHSFIQESTRLYSLKCSEVVQLLPQEVWNLIFFHAFSLIFENEDASTKLTIRSNDNLEPNTSDDSAIVSIFRNLSQVSRHFCGLVGEFLRSSDYFRNIAVSSNWLLSQCTNLIQLDLGTKGIVIRDSALEKLTNVTWLNLRNNTCLTDAAIMKLRNLTFLSFHSNDKITDESLKYLTKLRTLYLSKCNIGVTNASVSSLTNLSTLSLTHHPFISDRIIENLTNLTMLTLDGKSTVSGQCLKRLTNLTSLSLAFNPRIDPSYVEQCTQLSCLNITQNDLFTDQCMKKLTNLTRLKSNFIGYEGLKYLVKLVDLDIEGTHHSCLSNQDIMNLTQLTDYIALQLFQTWEFRT